MESGTQKYVDERDQVEEQAREIAVLKANVVTDNSVVLVNALAELERLKAKPSGVVQWPDADEIMQMAFEEGQPSEDASGYYFELEEFDLFIQRLMEEVTHLNSSPASAGDEPIHYWFIGDVGQEAGQRRCKKSSHDGSLALFESESDAKRAVRRHPGTEVYMVEYYRKPQALSALPTNHSEQVPELSSFVAFADALGLDLRQSDDQWNSALELYEKLIAAYPQPSADLSAPTHGEQVRQMVPGDDELYDLASSACQMALAHGVGEESFMALARTVRDRCAMLAASPSAGSQGGDV